MRARTTTARTRMPVMTWVTRPTPTASFGIVMPRPGRARRTAVASRGRRLTLIASHQGLGFGGREIEALGEGRRVLAASDEDVAGVDVDASLEDVGVRRLVADVHEGHHFTAPLAFLVVLVLSLEREHVDIDHH